MARSLLQEPASKYSRYLEGEKALIQREFLLHFQVCHEIRNNKGIIPDEGRNQTVSGKVAATQEGSKSRK